MRSRPDRTSIRRSIVVLQVAAWRSSSRDALVDVNASAMRWKPRCRRALNGSAGRAGETFALFTSHLGCARYSHICKLLSAPTRAAVFPRPAHGLLFCAASSLWAIVYGRHSVEISMRTIRGRGCRDAHAHSRANRPKTTMPASSRDARQRQESAMPGRRGGTAGGRQEVGTASELLAKRGVACHARLRSDKSRRKWSGC